MNYFQHYLKEFPERLGMQWIQSLEKRKRKMSFSYFWIFISLAFAFLITGLIDNRAFYYALAIVHGFSAFAFVAMEITWRRICHLKKEIEDIKRDAKPNYFAEVKGGRPF